MTEPKQQEAPILIERSMQEYFKDALGSSLKKRRLSLSDTSEFYLTNLLSEYAQAETMFSGGHDRDSELPTLASLLAEALEGNRSQKISGYRKLGDVSLYMSGSFPDSFQRRGIDLEYCVNMGETAYGNVSTLLNETRDSLYDDVFVELSKKFKTLVDILNEMSEAGQLSRSSDMVKLYERWLSTRSKRLYQKLVAKGLIPVGGH